MAATEEKAKKAFPNPAFDKVVLTREEKSEFVGLLATKFGDKAFRDAFLATKAMARARHVVRSAALRAKMDVKCLEHRATFADLVRRGADDSAATDADKGKVHSHWRALDNAAKGSRKIVTRLQKQKVNADKGDFRRKHKKHQSRHY
mmetsp:Transcript_21048/g.64988  ORF Transcript_21048/g.64988 Transcript_21048/m.64988 type:complete len:147 (-) Transcript_21048:154-594(-)